MGKVKEEIGTGQEALKEDKEKVKRPPMYRVILLNDDYTPMDFVVEILSRFFNMDSDQATQIMLTIHYKGKGSCGIFTVDVAETKVDQVCKYARKHQHPLMCTMEKV
ncbi:MULTISPECIES: ATP-dependent Clp protease adapter ClpS [unclassified Thalassotalea]|uniref:ATP-dependent Clp protease adapter ClpS n=1 Tax=unclassified Thalassotalea TaxID=2614972 RepID=UPI001080B5DC|nr:MULTISPECIES: ATP-dependent Clp protease adapter ClpS [unclassified Thalassotalea]NMP15397.1 ATP-dependent Clp protease adapter ClpS [Thalassotalea sp. Y01]QBY05954.1 ATP-dependent Clp protease adapter ClpS [Thalassotalea sp. HSM 43]